MSLYPSRYISHAVHDFLAPPPTLASTSYGDASVDWHVQVSFDVDLKVNVFEANIRLLGGLLSAHLLASDESLGLMQKPYHGELLVQAADLGARLMAAFEGSPSGMASSCTPHLLTHSLAHSPATSLSC